MAGVNITLFDGRLISRCLMALMMAVRFNSHHQLNTHTHTQHHAHNVTHSTLIAVPGVCATHTHTNTHSPPLLQSLESVLHTFGLLPANRYGAGPVIHTHTHTHTHAHTHTHTSYAQCYTLHPYCSPWSLCYTHLACYLQAATVLGLPHSQRHTHRWRPLSKSCGQTTEMWCPHSTQVCVAVCVYVCLCACMSTCRCECVYVCVHANMRACVFVFVCVCLCTCVCV